EVEAEEPLDEKADPEQNEGVDDERPVARELQDDRGLERLDLGEGLRQRDGVEGEAEQAEENDVLDRPEPFVQAPGHAELRHLEPLRDGVAELLQGAERAKP